MRRGCFEGCFSATPTAAARSAPTASHAHDTAPTPVTSADPHTRAGFIPGSDHPGEFQFCYGRTLINAWSSLEDAANYPAGVVPKGDANVINNGYGRAWFGKLFRTDENVRAWEGLACAPILKSTFTAPSHDNDHAADPTPRTPPQTNRTHLGFDGHLEPALLQLHGRAAHKVVRRAERGAQRRPPGHGHRL